MDLSGEEMTNVEEILGHPINIDHTEFDNASFTGLPCPLTNLVPKMHHFFIDIARIHKNIPHSCPLNNLIRPMYIVTSNHTGVKIIMLLPGKTLNINNWLTELEEHKLFDTLVNRSKSFNWDYTNMRGIYPSVCTHHIYTKDVQPIHQSQ